MIHIYTDGSSRGNPGPGGYGVVMIYGKFRKELAVGFRKTTNNRMELLAVIEALKCITNKEKPVTLYSDSKYVTEAINKNWLNGWVKKQFAKVKNPDLWKQLVPLLAEIKVEFVWVKGHDSNVENNRCDILATYVAENGPHLIDVEYEKNENQLDF